MAVPLPDNDGALVRLAIDGNTDAFGVLYERYFPVVFDFLARLLRQREDAADVTQDTFVKAMNELPTIRDPDRFKSWLFTIAHRQGLNRIRSSKRKGVRATAAIDDEERATMAVADLDPTVNPEEMAATQEAADIVWSAAAGLEPRAYAVMDLHVRQGLGSAEIAEVMGVSRANAYTMISRMKRSFSHTLATYLLVLKGREGCDELARIVPSDAEKMTASLRRKADRHVAKCEACAENRSLLVAPVRIFTTLLLVPVPAGLKAAIWDGVGAAAAVGAGAAVASQGGSGGAATTGAEIASGAAAGPGAETAVGLLGGIPDWVLGVAAAASLATAAVVGNGIMDGTDEPAVNDEVAMADVGEAPPEGSANVGMTPPPSSEEQEPSSADIDLLPDEPAVVDGTSPPPPTGPTTPPTTPPPTTPPPTTVPPSTTTTSPPPGTTMPPTTTTVPPPTTTTPPSTTTTSPPTATTLLPPITLPPPPTITLPPLPEATILLPLVVAPPLLCVLPAIVNAEVLNPTLARLTVKTDYQLRSGGNEIDSGTRSVQSSLPVILGVFTFPLGMDGNHQGSLDVTITVTDQDGDPLDQAARNNVAVSCL